MYRIFTYSVPDVQYTIIRIYVICIGLYTIYSLIYWKMKGVPSLSVKFPYLSAFHLSGVFVCKSNMIKQYYREMKVKSYKYAGVVNFFRPCLIVKDLEMVHDLMMEGYEYFDDEGFHKTDMYWPQNEEVKMFYGLDWKEMRYLLSPQMLYNKLKPLFKSVLDVTPYLIEAIEDCASEMRDIDIRELFACFTTDIITYHSYKINCYSYKRSGSKFCKCSSDRLCFLGLRTAEENVSHSLYQKIRKYIEYRKSQNYKGLDFFPLNFFMKDWSEDKAEPLMFFEMTDRVHHFFYCSFDVSSTTLYFAVYELCRNLDIQDRARREIENVMKKCNNQLTWETLREMKYLDQVINETLRLYPPVPNAVKLCQKKGYRLQGTDVKISSFTEVVIPIFCLHRDPDYFTDPDKFDPERFDATRESKNPPFFMPYGEGPRGYRSIQMCMVQTKVGLVEILRNFRLSISPRTYLPLKVHPKIYVEPGDVLYINAEKI